jgi:adenosylcobinamide-GDP ribazoletransferase
MNDDHNGIFDPPPVTESGTARRDAGGLLAALGEAVRFLTILPVPGLPPMTERGIVRAIPFFPLAGLLIGALLVAIGWAAGQLWGGNVRAVLMVVAWGVLTAGLHLDGLSDTFDAVMSWRPRARKLEIMKDSRIGAMGALALLAVLGLKAAWLDAAGAAWWQAALLAPVLGRWADIYGILRFPPAAEGGLGRAFRAQARPSDLWVGAATALALALLIAGAHGLVAAAAVWLTAELLGRWWTRALGGLTGDTYGALCEIGEVVALAVLSAM